MTYVEMSLAAFPMPNILSALDNKSHCNEIGHFFFMESAASEWRGAASMKVILNGGKQIANAGYLILLLIREEG